MTHEKPDALTRMVGGAHYLKNGIQPFEFAMANQWDACSFSVLKYLTRWRHKDGLADLRKARHIVEIGMALGVKPMKTRVLDYIKKHVNRDYLTPHVLLQQKPPTPEIPMSRYVAANEISDTDAVPLMALESWVEGRIGGDVVLGVIDHLVERNFDGLALADLR
jgi:hypothetical protein